MLSFKIQPKHSLETQKNNTNSIKVFLDKNFLDKISFKKILYVAERNAKLKMKEKNPTVFLPQYFYSYK